MSETCSTATPSEPSAAISEPTYQCPKCYYLRPASSFTGRKDGKCIECVRSEMDERREQRLARQVEDLAKKLMTDRGIPGHAMGTIEEFFGELDLAMGGPRMVATRMSEVIDGLIDKGALSSAGQLLLQLQKLRFLVQKQHTEEDFTQLDLEQKRDRLRLEVLQFISEQNDDDERRRFMELVLAEHGVENEALKPSTLRKE